MSADDDTCPACGAPLASLARQGSGEIVLRAALPQQIAGALLRTRMLSPREMAVFELLGVGYDNRSLARTLHVSERTAKRHVTAILAKLGLESRLQAGLTALLTATLPPRDLGWPEGRMDRLSNPQ
jgi:DNA-binding NarL/FixJ family response regulator